MTAQTSRQLANAVLITAGVAAAYVVLTKPPLRRLALTGIRWWLGGSIPVYLVHEIRRAWIESGRAA
jgi:hypothetical protein